MNKIVLLLLLILCGYSYAVENIEANQKVVEQNQGDFGEMKREKSTPLGAIQPIFDKSKKSAVYDIEYNPSKEIRLRLREWMQTVIVFPKWEKIKKVAVGNDLLVKAVLAKDNVVILTPIEIGADTSVSVIGENTYSFYTRTEGYNSNNMPDLKVNVRAFPPKHIVDSPAHSDVKDEVKHWLSEPINPMDLDFNYSMSGSESIAPEFVYSDGHRTWLYYGDKMQERNQPAIFVVEDGVDIPVMNDTFDKYIVVQAKGRLTLINGTEVTCIYPSHLGRHSYVR